MITQEMNFRYKAIKHGKPQNVHFRITHNLSEFGASMDELFDSWFEQVPRECATSQYDFVQYMKQQINNPKFICYAEN